MKTINNKISSTIAIKVCGLKFASNIQAVASLQPDFIGFIFYPSSPRYAKSLDVEILRTLPDNVRKIGVFVNENIENILTVAHTYDLDGVQLHGYELMNMCRKLKNAGYIVIKSFPIAEAYNFKVTKSYQGTCDYYLFDTKTASYGGSGIKFNWTLLEEYIGDTPFFISGGISPDDAEAIRNINHPQFAGIDLNSRFEKEPGEKDIELLKGFIQQL